MSKVYLSVDQDGAEKKFDDMPIRYYNPFINYWIPSPNNLSVYGELPIGTIQKLTGRKLTWEDEPVLWEGKNL